MFLSYDGGVLHRAMGFCRHLIKGVNQAIALTENLLCSEDPSRSHEGKGKVGPDLEEMGIPKEVPVNMK